MGKGNGEHNLALTERDYELLLSVYHYRYLSIGQLRKLHFPSQQTANRRVRALAGANFVADFRPPGSEDRLIMLGENGARAVAEHMGMSVDDLGWKRKRDKPKDYYFLKHFMAVNDVRIAITKACTARSDVELLGFIPEYEGETSSKGVVRKHIRDVVTDSQKAKGEITHTPDAVFVLGKEGKSALFFVEVDRGTETLSDAKQGFLKTIRFYLNYLLSENYQRYKEDFKQDEDFRAFRVLVLTPAKRRLTNIRKLGATFAFEPEHAKRFIWSAQTDEVNEDTILTASWRSLAESDEEVYRIVP